MKEPKAFRENEEVEPGAFLASVERDKAWIARGKEREKLEILPVGSRARPTGTAASAVAPQAAPRPPPGGTQAVGAPDASSGAVDEEGPSARERRSRSRERRR
jgi:hypothetical protein